MIAGPDLALVAALIGDPARAAMLSTLCSGESYPSTMLASRAGVSAQTASAHLAKLASAGLVKAVKNGRYRLYCLGGHKVADALEALAAVSPQHAVKSLHQSDDSIALKRARMCYDHLAGFIGVLIAEDLVRRAVVAPRGRSYGVTQRGRSWFARFGIDSDALANTRRKLATQCLDWSERRPHIGGGLGAAIARRAIELGWFARARSNRSLRITEEGRVALERHFRIAPGS